MKWLIGVAAAAGLCAALAFFEPWTLFIDSETVESVPTPGPSAPELSTEIGGTFVSQEHTTEGTARLLTQPDGSRVLRLEDFSTSNGPDLHVWLSAEAAGGNWFKYDEADHVALGPLRANRGSHNYPVPATASLDHIRSVVIWCDRFNVAFGSAPLQ